MPLRLDYDVYFPGGALWEEFTGVLARLGWNRRPQLVAQPMRNEVWKALEAGMVRGEHIRVPMLFIGGWYDIYADAVVSSFLEVREKGGERARRHSRLIMGPWVHRTDQAQNGELSFPGAAGYGMKRARAFLDACLRGIGAEAVEREPAIAYYQMGSSQWRSSALWPPADVRTEEFYLHPGGSLSSAKPSAAAEPAVFRFDPANPAPTVGGHVLDPGLRPGPADQREKVESRRDVVAFTGAVLDRDLAIAGRVTVRVYVSTDQRDTDFTAVLTDVYPDGRSMLIGEGIRRMRFRNTTSREDLPASGEVYAATINLDATAITFLAGHRVRLLISSSNHPRYAVNRNDGGPLYREGKGIVATNRVYHDAGRPSALILPVAGQPSRDR